MSLGTSHGAIKDHRRSLLKWPSGSGSIGIEAEIAKSGPVWESFLAHIGPTFRMLEQAYQKGRSCAGKGSLIQTKIVCSG